MKKAFRKYGLMALAAVACVLGMQGCYVDSDCYTRTSCATVCDFFYCWDECDEEYICEEDDNYYPNWNEAQCYTNRDCASDSYCQSGQCYQYNSGSVPFCGKCDITDDCIEGGAVCVALDDNTQACMRYCEDSSTCPQGYSCLEMAGAAPSGGVKTKQCYPDNGSCDASYCRDSRDCVQNGDCIGNRCVVPTTNLKECENNNQCAEKYGDYGICFKNKNDERYCTQTCYVDSQCDVGYSCYLPKSNTVNKKILDMGICLTSNDGGCVFSSDCDTSIGMVCNDGKCMKTCSRNEDCQSDYVPFQCIGGICRL